jgi:hypothetical protein
MREPSDQVQAVTTGEEAMFASTIGYQRIGFDVMGQNRTAASLAGGLRMVWRETQRQLRFLL